MAGNPRAAAEKAGEKFYQGQPCPREGHGRKRYTTTGTCYDCCRVRDAVAGVKRKATAEANRATSFNWPVTIIGNPDRVRAGRG